MEVEAKVASTSNPVNNIALLGLSGARCVQSPTVSVSQRAIGGGHNPAGEPSERPEILHDAYDCGARLGVTCLGR
jgi:hypothetical protein